MTFKDFILLSMLTLFTFTYTVCLGKHKILVPKMKNVRMIQQCQDKQCQDKQCQDKQCQDNQCQDSK